MKKGFTLIELLAVIVILSLIIVITGLGISKVIKSTKNDINQTQREAILEAAKIWSADNLEKIPRVGCISLDNEYVIAAGNFAVKPGNDWDFGDLGVIICSYPADSGDKIDYELVKKDNTPTDLSCFSYTVDTDAITITGFDYHSCSTKKIVIPSMINFKSVRKIGDYAFGQMNIERVVIPNTVKIIGNNAFATNELTELIIPESVTSIGFKAFSENSISKLIILNGEELSIGDSAFNTNKLTNVIIPDSVSSIGYAAFDVNNLSKVYFGGGIDTIGDLAFGGHLDYDNLFSNELTSVVIDKHSTEVIYTPNTFYWAKGYNDSNIRWLKDE